MLELIFLNRQLKQQKPRHINDGVVLVIQVEPDWTQSVMLETSKC
jgi:hypothetical protein